MCSSIKLFIQEPQFHICFTHFLQLGGVITPNDGECHLSGAGEYTHSTILDYPSISQINAKVQENSINIIFAVTEQQIGIYDRLAQRTEGAFSAVLSNDSSNVVDLVREQYSVSKQCNWNESPYFIAVF